MTPRERVLAVLNRQPVDRFPVDLWYTPQVGQALCEHFKVGHDSEIYRALGLDKIVWVFIDYCMEQGRRAGAQVGAQTSEGRTMWGVSLKPVQAGTAHYDEFGAAPMADHSTPADLDDYPYWPSLEGFDYEGFVIRAQNASKEYAVIGPWVSFFEIYCQLRGLEQALMDLVVNPDLVTAVLDGIEFIQTEMMKRVFERAGKWLDLVFISDDIAGQTGLLMSPGIWRQHLRPRLIRWCQLIHSYGLKVFYHTDGAAGDLIEPLIDCGIDVLNPIQHACPGMELESLKKRYGNRLIFHGGIDNQSVLPFGSPDDVRRETLPCSSMAMSRKRSWFSIVLETPPPRSLSRARALISCCSPVGTETCSEGSPPMLTRNMKVLDPLTFHCLSGDLERIPLLRYAVHFGNRLACHTRDLSLGTGSSGWPKTSDEAIRMSKASWSRTAVQQADDLDGIWELGRQVQKAMRKFQKTLERACR